MSQETPVLGFFEKRELLYAEPPNPSALRKAAEEFLAQGLLEDALAFFQRAGDAAGAEKVLEAARQAGDAFAFDAALKALDRNAGPEEWVKVAETALAAGLLSFAYRAFEKADNQAGLERVRKEMAAQGVAPPGEH